MLVSSPESSIYNSFMLGQIKISKIFFLKCERDIAQVLDILEFYLTIFSFSFPHI